MFKHWIISITIIALALATSGLAKHGNLRLRRLESTSVPPESNSVNTYRLFPKSPKGQKVSRASDGSAKSQNAKAQKVSRETDGSFDAKAAKNDKESERSVGTKTDKANKSREPEGKPGSTEKSEAEAKVRAAI